eukprot:sb/3474374/
MPGQTSAAFHTFPNSNPSSSPSQHSLTSSSIFSPNPPNFPPNPRLISPSALRELFTQLIPAIIFGILLFVCLTAIMCRNVVRYFSRRNCPTDSVQLACYDEQMLHSTTSSHEQLEDVISPQNARQMVVDSELTDVMYS